MPREISDEEYAFLQGRRQVADFVEPIYQHPKWGKEAKRLIKQVYPNVKIPDFDIEEQVNTRFAEQQKKRDDEDTAKKQKEQNDAWQAKRTAVKKEYGFTDEAMVRLEDWMLENNVGSYEVAAAYKASKEPQTSEPEYDAGHWHHDRQEGFAEIAKDPESWARNEILQAIHRDEQRARQQR
jgi:hypothetical protein